MNGRNRQGSLRQRGQKPARVKFSHLNQSTTKALTGIPASA